jgi:hypothetical protein
MRSQDWNPTYRIISVEISGRSLKKLVKEIISDNREIIVRVFKGAEKQNVNGII